MTAHTPGPWAIDPDPRPDMGWNNHIVSAQNPDFTVCFMTHDGTKENEMGDANARLISAAPELLEALKVAVLLMEEDGRCDCPEVENGPCALCFARAAIAKATGGGK